MTPFDPRDEPLHSEPADRAAMMAAAGIVPKAASTAGACDRPRLRDIPPLTPDEADAWRRDLTAAIALAHEGAPSDVRSLAEMLGAGMATPRVDFESVAPMVYRTGAAAVLASIVEPWGGDPRPLVALMLKTAHEESRRGVAGKAAADA